MFVTNCFLKLLDLFGCHIRENESRIKVSKEFKDTFKDITIVKKSKQNTKLKPSVNLMALVILLIAVTLIVVNLKVVSGSCITHWLYTSTFLNKFIGSEQSLEVTYTALLFSVLSFSISKLLSQWKETKEIRKTKKQIKLRDKAFQITSSKELLDAAKLRDATRYEELKHVEDD